MKTKQLINFMDAYRFLFDKSYPYYVEINKYLDSFIGTWGISKSKSNIRHFKIIKDLIYRFEFEGDVISFMRFSLYGTEEQRFEKKENAALIFFSKHVFNDIVSSQSYRDLMQWAIVRMRE